MSGRREKRLSQEDRVLWNRVARSVTPLAGRSVETEAGDKDEFAVMLAASQPGPERPGATLVVPAQASSRLPGHGFDRPTRARLAKGRLAIEGKVDLHGLTQSEAHALLLSFLHRAQADGRRHVLVVTGKGASLGSEGVLRRAVPGWLATPPFRVLVGAYEPAASRHGGSGALYVRLRRRDGGPA